MSWVSRVTNAVGLSELPALRRLIVGVVGGTLLLIGIALVVLPGPAFIVIPMGLALLASEFAWARRAIRRAKVMIEKARRGGLTGKSRSMADVSR